MVFPKLKIKNLENGRQSLSKASSLATPIVTQYFLEGMRMSYGVVAGENMCKLHETKSTQKRIHQRSIYWSDWLSWMLVRL
jgi:hypothetical protein